MGSQKRIAKVQPYSPFPATIHATSKLTARLKELAELTESPPAGITVELANESNLYEWKVFMDGPEGSPYHVRCTSFPQPTLQ